MKTLVAIFAFVLAASAAIAGDAPREIDFTTQLKGPGDLPITECTVKADNVAQCPEEKRRNVTLSDVAVVSLLATLDKDRTAPAIDKFRNDELARKIYGNAHAMLSVEEIAKIKERVGAVYSAAEVGAAWRLLDPSVN